MAAAACILAFWFTAAPLSGERRQTCGPTRPGTAQRGESLAWEAKLRRKPSSHNSSAASRGAPTPRCAFSAIMSSFISKKV